MTTDYEIHDRQVRCQLYLLELQMLARVEAEPAAAEIDRTTGAIIAEVSAASSVVLATAEHRGARPFLQVRLNRLTTAAQEAIAAARDGDHAALRRALHRFEALTSAIWTVQDGVREPGR
jgi:predicted lipid-binding transport protein (Tim44 family)